MPVTVSLLDLAKLPGSKNLWPAEFAALNDKLEDQPGCKTHYGVIADWLDENGEGEFARVFRWFMKGKSSLNSRYVNEQGRRVHYWMILDLPNSVFFTHHNENRPTRATAAGTVALFAEALAEAQAKAKQALEELS